MTGTPAERIRRIVWFLNGKEGVNFKYTSGMSLTANEAYRQKQGDCLAYTNLFMGIARHLQLPCYFVHIREARDYYEREGLFFINSHMAVGYSGDGTGIEEGLGLYTLVVDFAELTSGLGLQLYQSLDDAEATALFYNNVAVDNLLAGDINQAEKMLRFLISTQPQLQELTNNLGVVLMRQGRYEEALAVLQAGIQKAPTYQPFYTNAIQAARACHKTALAQRLESDAAKWSRRDPFFLFNEGVDLYQKKQYGAAVETFQKAAKIRPNNPSLECWLARAYLASGQTERGTESFLKAQGLSPNYPLLSVLRDEFPALAEAPRVMLNWSQPTAPAPILPEATLPAPRTR